MALVSGLEPQRRPSRVSVFLDGEFWRGLDAALAAELGLRTGQEIDEERLSLLAQADDRQKCYAYCLRLLGYRQRTVWEVGVRLRQRGYREDVCQGTLRRLTDCGLLDDRRFAEEWVDARFHNLHGRTRIRKELLSKGLAKDIVEEALRRITDDAESDSLAKALSRRSRALERLDRTVTRRRLTAWLLRRGYSPEGVARALRGLETAHERGRTDAVEAQDVIGDDAADRSLS